MFFLLIAVPIAAQNGGKAEPKRVRFASGKSETILRGALRNGQEMEYVFAAHKGQRITVTNRMNSKFDVRIFSGELDLETEFDSSSVFSVDAVHDGDYLLFIRKKMIKGARPVRFAVMLMIR